MSQILVTGEAKIRDIQGPVVANSGVITALDGAASQYVRGDGTLADFPTSTGGGSSVSYYLNSSVSQGTIGGVAYRQLSKTPISGAGTDITISANGYIASYITDANDPSLLEVPAGNFNCEFYFSVNSNNHNPYVYAELYKYDGTTFTLLGSNQAIPEYLTNGTTLSAYYFAIPVAVAALTITDRLAIRIYVNVDTRTVTLHTENNHLCQVVTTFSKGLTSLNNLTRQVQFLATGTSGTDFNISSVTATHTFNLPVASATNTGKLSSTDWSTFNNKQPAGNYVTLDTTQTITGAKTFDAAYFNGAEFNNTAYFNQGLWLVKNGVPIVYTALQTTIYSEATTNNVVFRDNASKAKLEFNNSTQTYTFPAASGTIALTSNINYPVTSVFGRTGAVVAASGDYTTTQVTEGTNLYFTDARSRAALSFTAGSGAYNSTTGVITIPTDNNQISNGAGYITSSALSGYLPLSGGTLTGGLNGTTATFSGLGTFYQLTMTGATAGRLFYAQTGGVFSQSGNLVWNNSTEQLGVGTPNPSAVVTAFSTNAATQLKAAGTAPAITFSNTLTSASLACVFGLATANNHFVTGTAAGDMAIANQSTSPGAIIFGTDTFEKMRMSSNGNFGIATSSPATKLDVSGTIRSISQTDPTSGVGMELFYRPADTSSYIQSYDRTNGAWRDVRIYGNTLYFGTQGNNNLTINTSGNVGIGTTSTDGKLHVNAGTGQNFVVAGDGTNICSINNYSSSSGFRELKIVGSPLTFYTGNAGEGSVSERMRILSGGVVNVLNDLGVGTATPSGKIHGVGINASSSNNVIYLENAVASILFRVRNDGLITTGTASASPYNNTTGGSGNVLVDSGGNLYRATSSLKYKKNVQDYTKGLSEVLKLRPVTYEGKSEADKGKIFGGLIAEEVHELGLTEFVVYAEDGTPDALAYSNMVTLAFKAIQELKAEIEILKNK